MTESQLQACPWCQRPVLPRHTKLDRPEGVFHFGCEREMRIARKRRDERVMTEYDRLHLARVEPEPETTCPACGGEGCASCDDRGCLPVSEVRQPELPSCTMPERCSRGLHHEECARGKSFADPKPCNCPRDSWTLGSDHDSTCPRYRQPKLCTCDRSYPTDDSHALNCPASIGLYGSREVSESQLPERPAHSYVVRDAGDGYPAIIVPESPLPVMASDTVVGSEAARIVNEAMESLDAQCKRLEAERDALRARAATVNRSVCNCACCKRTVQILRGDHDGGV